MHVHIPQDLSERYTLLSALTGKNVEAIVSDALHEFMENTGSSMIDMLVGEPDGGPRNYVSPVRLSEKVISIA